MGAFRRSLFACAVAGAGAVGCTTPTFLSPAPTEPYDPLPRNAMPGDGPRERAAARGQLPTRAPAVPSPPPNLAAGTPPAGAGAPAPLEDTDRPLPINLATALKLAGARPLDVQIAGQQVAVAAALYDRARVLWLPNVAVGADYFLHTGPQQNFAGELLSSNRNTFMFGFGPNVVFSFSDAIYAPLAARQELRARQAVQQASVNDATQAVAEAYFGVQQARGELAGALAAEARAEELVRKTAELTKGLAPPAEDNRARAELGRRKFAVAAARERWRTSSAELARLLRLDASAVVEPAEPPFLPVTVIDASAPVDELIPLALNVRPELAGHQAFVQATLARLKQEKVRPLVPSLAVRSVSTNPSGSLGYGTFGGGRAGTLRNFDGRFDIDVQLLWEFSALGFGNRARVHERRAEYEVATLELFRTQDRIAAEVAAAFAQVRASAQRLNAAEPALREAIDLVQKSVDGLGQTRRVGDSLTLVVRPQEAVAAVQAFAQANGDFFAAVADYNRAQFRLYRALGHPASHLAGAVSAPAATAAPEGGGVEPRGPGLPQMRAPERARVLPLERPRELPPVPPDRPLELPPLPAVSSAPPDPGAGAGPLAPVIPTFAPDSGPKPARQLPAIQWTAAGPDGPPAELRPPVVVEEPAAPAGEK